MKVPGFLLRRLYVKGSLAATEGGFEFQICNRLGSGYARRLLPLTLDGEACYQRAFEARVMPLALRLTMPDSCRMASPRGE